MTYPEAVDKFVEKLNKADTVYVIEDEELVLEDGVFEGELAHDNVKNESVMVFTEPKMSGERIENFFLSIPSNAPWKRIIKVFANAPKVYVTYETTGDQVEAEDINRVQESIVNTQKEVERYKAANDQAVSDLDTRLSTVESKKADKTYVDTELLKKADKENTYTKAETDSRIQAIIGAAPEALDTLAEIAEALNNDPDFAATITNMLAQKVDKVAGMGLSEANFTNEEKTKLSTIEEGANKYIHPSTHPASMIVETSEKRFVSDIEKAAWNAKETPAGAQAKADIAEQNAKAYADIVANTAETNAKNYADNKIDDLAGAGRTTETVKEVADDLASHKANTANPHNVTKSQVGLANVDNVKQASKTEFDSHNNDTTRHITAEERTRWNNKAEVSQIPTKVSELENDKNFVTQEELGNAGYGDMLKSIYDTDNDGKVDAAEAADNVPWSGITGKPSTFTPSSHTHTKEQITDFPNSLPANGGNADTVDGYHAEDFQKLTDGGAYGIFPSTASTMVGNEYNILLYAKERGVTITQSGTGLLSNPYGLFDGRIEPNYSSDGIDPDNPYVLLIEGLPNIHTQTGGVFGWTCRYWYPYRYKVEFYDSYQNTGWKVAIDQSQTPKSAKELLIPIYSRGLSGSITKIKITIYESESGDIGNNGFKRWGMSEIFFCHPEAVSVNEYLKYLYASIDHNHDALYMKKAPLTWNDLKGVI